VSRREERYAKEILRLREELSHLRIENVKLHNELRACHDVRGAITGDATIECHVTYEGYRAVGRGAFVMSLESMGSADRAREIERLSRRCLDQALRHLGQRPIKEEEVRP
jgi:hypothetical protein